MEITFHSHANKAHFHKKGCALSLSLKVRVFGTRKWPIKQRGSMRFVLGRGEGRGPLSASPKLSKRTPNILILTCGFPQVFVIRAQVKGGEASHKTN